MSGEIQLSYKPPEKLQTWIQNFVVATEFEKG